ncbi:MAG: flagellar biosynthesis anti-sigma factor FlgM [Rhodocyclaceae bacterium]|nr:flagellar biosynthesis anti-sigma factor FlgM [Rhodocyclaceae bacterium]
MKIDNSIKPVGNLDTGDNRAKAVPSAGAPPSAAPAGDRVELTSLSSGMQKAEEAIQSTPVVNQVRVDEIKQAIAEGRFKVDANKVADGLVDSVRQMLAAQPNKV